MSAPYPSAPKRLERSTTDKFLAGVCGGVARYLNMDPTLVRVLWVILTLVLGGAPLIVYLVMIFVVPEENSPGNYPPVNGPQAQPGWSPYPQHDQPGHPPAPAPSAGPAPRPTDGYAAGDPVPGGESQAVWGEAGAPWEQPATPRVDQAAEGPDAVAQPSPERIVEETRTAVTPGSTDAPGSTEDPGPVGGPDPADEATPTAATGSDTSVDAATPNDTAPNDTAPNDTAPNGSHTASPADHNEEARGQQPMS